MKKIFISPLLLACFFSIFTSQKSGTSSFAWQEKVWRIYSECMINQGCDYNLAYDVYAYNPQQKHFNFLGHSISQANYHPGFQKAFLSCNFIEVNNYLKIGKKLQHAIIIDTKDEAVAEEFRAWTKKSPNK